MCRVFCVLLACCLMALGCAVNSDKPEEVTPETIAVAQGNNEFAFDLYAHLAKEAKE